MDITEIWVRKYKRKGGQLTDDKQGIIVDGKEISSEQLNNDWDEIKADVEKHKNKMEFEKTKNELTSLFAEFVDMLIAKGVIKSTDLPNDMKAKYDKYNNLKK